MLALLKERSETGPPGVLVRNFVRFGIGTRTNVANKKRMVAISPYSGFNTYPPAR